MVISLDSWQDWQQDQECDQQSQVEVHKDQQQQQQQQPEKLQDQKEGGEAVGHEQDAQEREGWQSARDVGISLTVQGSGRWFPLDSCVLLQSQPCK